MQKKERNQKILRSDGQEQKSAKTHWRMWQTENKIKTSGGILLKGRDELRKKKESCRGREEKTE